MIEQTYKLDLVPQGMLTVVHVSQYDVGSRKITFELQKDGIPFTPGSGLTAYMEGRKPDGNVFFLPMTTSGNKVSIVLSTQMTIIDGDIPCEVVLTDSDSEQIGTSNFILAVEKSPVDTDDISESTLPIFEVYAQEAAAAAAIAVAAAESLSPMTTEEVEEIWDYEEEE